MCVLSFPTTFVWNISHCKNNSEIYCHNVHVFMYKYLLFLLGFNQCMISAFCHEVDENCALLWYYTAYLLTPRCRVLPEQLTGLQLVKKFPAFHGTRRFITALTSVRHLSLSWASPITQQVVVISWQRFGTTYQSKIRQIGFPETSVRNYQY